MLKFLKRGVCEWFQKKKLDQNNQPAPKSNNAYTQDKTVPVERLERINKLIQIQKIHRQEITPKNPSSSIIQWYINDLRANFEDLVEEVKPGNILE
jgi:hypothetical protein